MDEHEMEMEITAIARHSQSPEPAACGVALEEPGMRNGGIKEMVATFGSKANAVPSACTM